MNGEEKTWQQVSLCGNSASIFDFIQNKSSIQTCFKTTTKGIIKWFLGSVNSCWSGQPDIDITSDALGSYKSASFVSGYIGLVGISEGDPTSILQLKVLGMPPFNCGNVQAKSVTSINVIDHGSNNNIELSGQYQQPTTMDCSSLQSTKTTGNLAILRRRKHLSIWICLPVFHSGAGIGPTTVSTSFSRMEVNSLVQKITIDILPSQVLQKHGR